MGFGTIIAGVYFVAVLIVSGYVVTDTVNRLSSSSYESVLTAASIQLNKVGSSANITGISVADEGAVIYANLTNTGEVKIVKGDFQQIDIILTYTDNSSITQTHWCYYDSNDPSQNRWSLNSAFLPNPFPGVVDPQDWDPAKTLSITIQLAQSQYLMPGSIGYLKVVLPGGSSTADTFAG